MGNFAKFAHERKVEFVVSCENGHENPDNRLFCGDCGVAIVPSMAICVRGHVNTDDQHFCGNCGIPLRPPGGVGSTSPNGRWDVDPSTKHQYRYWDGGKWTAHVADNGNFSVAGFSRLGRLHPETWVGIAAGLVTILLVVGAIVGIMVQLSGGSGSSAGAPTQTSPSTTAAAQTSTAPSGSATPSVTVDASTPVVAVIGTACRPNSTNATTADGSTAYCQQLPSTRAYMWSLYPVDIPEPAQGVDAAVAVCMEQTGRSPAQCGEYLQRPSNPGDGQAPRQ